MWAFAGAITAAGAAAVYAADAMAEEDAKNERRLQEIMQREERRMKDLRQMNEQEMSQSIAERKELIRLAQELGKNTREVGAAFDELGKQRMEIRKNFVQPFEDAMNFIASTGIGAEKVQSLLDGQAGEESRNALVNEVGSMVSAFDSAMKAGNQAAMKAMVENLLRSSQGARTAFIEAGEMTADGLKAMMTLVQESKHGAAGAFSEALGNNLSIASSRENRPKAPVVNMNGGQTFKIQQEFRDQDPDRIAIAFQDRLTRAAVSRVQSSTSMPFGA